MCVIVTDEPYLVNGREDKIININKKNPPDGWSRAHPLSTPHRFHALVVLRTLIRDASPIGALVVQVSVKKNQSGWRLVFWDERNQ
jgi:hypothetical protein